MQPLHHELSVLTKATAYKNISAAAEHIGLSQPQISRIIAKLEEELDVHLLDRSSKRTSTWTKMALELAKVYNQRIKKLNFEIQQVVHASYPKFIKVAALEGLLHYASDFCHQLLKISNLEGLELNIYDLSELEDQFSKKEIDLIITSREPGKKKYAYNKLIGYQSLDTINTKANIEAFSTFERNSTYHFEEEHHNKKYIISNSLVVRKTWIHKFGASGIIPSMIYQSSDQSHHQPVRMLAHDDFHHQLWKLILQIHIDSQKSSSPNF